MNFVGSYPDYRTVLFVHLGEAEEVLSSLPDIIVAFIEVGQSYQVSIVPSTAKCSSHGLLTSQLRPGNMRQRGEEDFNQGKLARYSSDGGRIRASVKANPGIIRKDHNWYCEGDKGPPLTQATLEVGPRRREKGLKTRHDRSERGPRKSDGRLPNPPRSFTCASAGELK